MPVDPPKKAPKGKGKAPAKDGGGFNKKVGGLPVWAWGALVLGAVAVGLYLRKRSGGGTTQPQETAAPPDTSGGGGIGGGTPGEDLSGLIGAIDQLITTLGAGTPTDKTPPPEDKPKPPPPAKAKRETRQDNAIANLRKQLREQRQHTRAKPRQSKPERHTKNTKHPRPTHPQSARVHEHKSPMRNFIDQQPKPPKEQTSPMHQYVDRMQPHRRRRRARQG